MIRNNTAYYGEFLYYIYKIKDTISISPSYFGTDINKAAEEILSKKYEGTLDKDLGVVLAIFNVRDISDGRILPGDPASHHDVTFDVLTYSLEVEEVVVGEVSEIADFGCFVRIGPLEGLVHLSQITTDFVNFDRKAGMFVMKATGRTLKKGDIVYAKVSTISMKNNVKDTKIALTMRPDGLGKIEWLKGPKPKAAARPKGRSKGS